MSSERNSATARRFFEFEDGKISAVRKYLDTQHAHDVWIAQVSSQDGRTS